MSVHISISGPGQAELDAIHGAIEVACDGSDLEVVVEDSKPSKQKRLYEVIPIAELMVNGATQVSYGVVANLVFQQLVALFPTKTEKLRRVEHEDRVEIIDDTTSCRVVFSTRTTEEYR